MIDACAFIKILLSNSFKFLFHAGQIPTYLSYYLIAGALLSTKNHQSGFSNVTLPVCFHFLGFRGRCMSDGKRLGCWEGPDPIG